MLFVLQFYEESQFHVQRKRRGELKLSLQILSGNRKLRLSFLLKCLYHKAANVF